MTTSACPRCQGPMAASDAGRYCPRCAGRLLMECNKPEETVPAHPTALRLGEYELGAELGRGAMGVVYRARQPRLRRDVAVKVILASRFAGEAARRRFLAEAELAAQLDHPNIVPIYEVGETADGPFYAMKLVEGGTLAERLLNTDSLITAHSAAVNGSQHSVISVAALVAKIARAVHHAHQRGVIHRDLKPGNILLDAQGEPHIADFGLAREMGAQSSLTHSGSSIGTPAYMSPEQARAEKTLTTASDVWSLGAILYHLLTGHPPFEGTTALEVMRKVMESEPARPGQQKVIRNQSSVISGSKADASLMTDSLNPDYYAAIDRDLETICLKCLEKDPARRYTSARALAEDLERWLNHEPILARPSTALERFGKWTRRHPAAALGTAACLVLLMAGLTGTIWQARRAEAQAHEVQHRLERMAVANGVKQVENGDLIMALPWFLEALQVVETRDGKQGDQTPHRIRFGTALRQAPQLAQVWFHEGPVASAAFSSDGRRLLTASADGTAHLWDSQTGKELITPLRHPSPVHQAAFSPDERWIATGCMDGTAQIWDAQTGKPVHGPLQHGAASWVKVAFSPDGHFLFTTGEDLNTRVWDRAIGQRVHEFSRTAGVYFSADGKRLVRALGSRADLSDAIAAERSSLSLSHGGDIRLVAFSRDGRLIVTAGQKGARLWNPTNGTPTVPPLQPESTLFHAEFSPDGTRLATAAQTGTARVWDTATGQPITPPLQHQGSVQQIVFSPDGRRVLTASDDHTACVWDAVSGVKLFSPLWHGSRVLSAAFSPDGNQILTACADGLVRLWNLSGAAVETFVLPGDSELRRAWLDGARQSLVTSARDNQVQVWSLPRGTALGPPIPLGSRCDTAALSPDGTLLATGSSGGTVQVWQIATGRPLSTSAPGLGARQVLWSPDGRRLVACGSSEHAHVLDPATGQALTPPLIHGHRVTHAAFDAAGQVLATVSNDGYVRLWNALDGRPLTPPLKQGGALRWVEFDSSGRLLATTSAKGTVQLWHTRNGLPVHGPMRHVGWANEVAFSQDGRWLLSSSDDGSARLWDTATGLPKTPPLRLHGGVWRPCLSRDNRLLLAANHLFAQVWESGTGAALTPLLDPHAGVLDVAFRRDERAVLMVTADRRLVSWNLAPITVPAEEMAARARLMSGRVLDATGALVPLEQALEGPMPGHLAALLARPSKQATNHSASPALDGPARARAILRRDWELIQERPAGQPEASGR